jgi:hypothetical protein
MKRGHIILSAGAALLVAGLVIALVWGISYASSLYANNTVIANTSIQPGASISAKKDVNALDKPVYLTIGLGEQQQSSPSDIHLKQVTTDPSGKTVSSSEFQKVYTTTINPTTTGTYTVTVSNLGTKPVTVSGTFGYIPWVGTEGNPTASNSNPGGGLSAVYAGGGLAAAGVVTLIVGGIVTVLDRRKVKEPRTTTR